jgi:hypothetical protein
MTSLLAGALRREPLAAAGHIRRSLAPDGTLLLVEPAAEATWRELLGRAGFGRVRRATETPFNRVFEARP